MYLLTHTSSEDRIKELILEGKTLKKIQALTYCSKYLFCRLRKELDKALSRVPEFCGPISKAWYNDMVHTWFSSRSKKKREKEDRKNVIKIHEALQIWEQQNGIDPFTGRKLIFPRTQKKHGFGLMTPSLDRLDNNVGHVFGNVRWVEKGTNLGISDGNDEEYIVRCNLVAARHPRRRFFTCGYSAFIPTVDPHMLEVAGAGSLSRLVTNSISGDLTAKLLLISLENLIQTYSSAQLMTLTEQLTNASLLVPR